MNIRAAADTLVQVIAAEGDALRACVAILNEEQIALMQGRFDELPAIEERKLAALDVAAQRTAAREAELARRKLPATREGMQSLIATEPKLGQVWKDALDWAKKARDLNRVSGFLIDARLGDNRQALDLLYQAGQPNATYGRDGHLQLRNGGRALAVG